MFILDCTQLDQMCYNWKPILIVFKYLIKIIQWSVPLLLIALGSWDMFKAMNHADKEETVKEAQSNLIKRIIYGLVIFIVPFLVRLVLNLVDKNIRNEDDYTSTTSWIGCWNDVMNDKDFSDCEDIYKKKAEDAIPDDDTTTPGTDSGSQSDCSSVKCPTNATFLGSSKSFTPIYYKNACYCKAVIPDPSIYQDQAPYSCSGINLNDENNDIKFFFSFSESDTNGNLFCYFKSIRSSVGSSGGSGGSDSGTCTKVCKRKNLVLGRSTDGTESNGLCKFKAVLDTDTVETSCDSACKRTWGKNEYKSSEYKNDTCICKYDKTCE